MDFYPLHPLSKPLNFTQACISFRKWRCSIYLATALPEPPDMEQSFNPIINNQHTHPVKFIIAQLGRLEMN